MPLAAKCTKIISTVAGGRKRSQAVAGGEHPHRVTGSHTLPHIPYKHDTGMDRAQFYPGMDSKGKGHVKTRSQLTKTSPSLASHNERIDATVDIGATPMEVLPVHAQKRGTQLLPKRINLKIDPNLERNDARCLVITRMHKAKNDPQKACEKIVQSASGVMECFFLRFDVTTKQKLIHEMLMKKLYKM